jgi:hypothetical protein
MRVPSAAGILKVRSDKRKVCLFLYLLWTWSYISTYEA